VRIETTTWTRLAIAATLATLVLALAPRSAGAISLAAPSGLSSAIARVSVAQEAAYICRYWHHGELWGRRCFASYGPFWPPTWRGSGWRGPGWYGAGWRKEYFYR
jgi:hypothetical protein